MTQIRKIPYKHHNYRLVIRPLARASMLLVFPASMGALVFFDVKSTLACLVVVGILICVLGVLFVYTSRLLFRLMNEAISGNNT